MHSQHRDRLRGSSSEQKCKPGFADSGWHVLLTLYVCLQLRHTSGGLILHITKKNQMRGWGLEKRMGEVPSWPEYSPSHSGHLLMPSPAQLGEKFLNGVIQDSLGALLICLASIMLPNTFERIGWRRTSPQHTHHCYFNCHIPLI